MRSNIVRVAVLASLVLGAAMAYALSTGPVATRTGAFKVQTKAAEPNCTVCHSASSQGIPAAINDTSGSIRILGLPSAYLVGTTYNLRVRLEHTWNPARDSMCCPLKWGFQLQAVLASTGDSAGTWVLAPNTPPDTFKIVRASTLSVYKNRRYLEHTRNASNPVDPNGSTHYGELGPVEWHVKWQAPAADIGKIYFFAAGNSANGDEQSVGSGDFVFTTAESIMGGSLVDVPAHPDPLVLRNDLEPPYPNPMAKCTDVSFTIARGGLVDIAVYDIQGRRVRTILREFREAGTHASFWDGKGDNRTYMRNGVYFIRLTPPDGRRISRKVVLAR